MFDGPQRAIRCAMAIRDAAQSLGIEVRAVLHTGECEIRGEDIGGIGVRGSALAGANDALVSSTLDRTRVRGPRRTRAQGGARRMASLRRRVYATVAGVLREAQPVQPEVEYVDVIGH